MADAKIDITIGELTFIAEGEQGWLAEQLQKVLDAAPSLNRSIPEETTIAPAIETDDETFTEPLASHIRKKGGGSNQVKRFLATADWLRLRGEGKLTTRIVSKALKDQQQNRLSNPADCLNKNVGKGYCEKMDDGFFITEDGLRALGHIS